MWLTGVFGIATKYGEAVLAVKYRITTPEGTMAGGPMYVLARGLRVPWLGAVFAALTAIAAFGIGNMVQANSISSMVQETFRGTPWLTGAVMTAFTAGRGPPGGQPLPQGWGGGVGGLGASRRVAR